MATAILRSAPDSRTVLRVLMWVTAGIGFLFLPATLRNASGPATDKRHFIGLWVGLTPWVVMAVATIIGTASQFEDAVFRRRIVCAVVLALPFPVIGLSVHYFLPNFRLGSGGGAIYLWWVYL